MSWSSLLLMGYSSSCWAQQPLQDQGSLSFQSSSSIQTFRLRYKKQKSHSAIILIKNTMLLCVAVLLILALKGQRWVDLCVFQANVVYLGSSRSAKATWWEQVSTVLHPIPLTSTLFQSHSSWGKKKPENQWVTGQEKQENINKEALSERIFSPMKPRAHFLSLRTCLDPKVSTQGRGGMPDLYRCSAKGELGLPLHHFHNRTPAAGTGSEEEEELSVWLPLENCFKTQLPRYRNPASLIFYVGNPTSALTC